MSTRVEDERLVASLVTQGEVGEARQVAEYLGGQTSDKGAIRNADFSRAPMFAPLDWQLLSSGGYGATIYPSDGVMVISALTDSSGVVARQLLDIAPGQYRLAAIAEAPADEGIGLSARLRCEGQREPFATFRLSDGETEFGGPAAVACNAVWIELRVRAGQGLDAGEVALESVTLEPL